MDDVVDLVRNANLARKKKHIKRRLLKLGEEYGEVLQAYLSVSSKSNNKNKSWADVREELCDVLIVTLDILLTQMPDEEYDARDRDEIINNRVTSEVSRKLKKWQNKTISNKEDESQDGRTSIQ